MLKQEKDDERLLVRMTGVETSKALLQLKKSINMGTKIMEYWFHLGQLHDAPA